MNMTILTVGSVTYAIKARKLLRRDGIQSESVKLDDTKTKAGCTHGIKIATEDFYHAASVLKENGIPFSVYQ